MMSVEVEVNSSNIRHYFYELCEARNKMQNDINELKTAYNKAAWNDMVAEKARLQLNEYIHRYNLAMVELCRVILAVEDMLQALDKYENVID